MSGYKCSASLHGNSWGCALLICILSVCILLKEKNILTLVTNGKEDFIHEFCKGWGRTGSAPNTEKAAGNLPLRSRLRGSTMGEK